MPVVLTNRGLTDAEIGGQTSTVLEPHVAKSGNEILLTGNWFATRSSNGGANWSFLNPYTFFPAVDGGFCCDQTALFKPTAPVLAFWLLQYIEKNGTNTLRVAVNRTGNMANNSWYWWDFKPVQVNGAWAGEWFDFNHAALTNNFLYVVSNAYKAVGGAWARCVVLRLPLATLATGGSLQYQWFQSAQSVRCTQGAAGTMYFASHITLSQIRVHSWADNANQIPNVNVNIAAWSQGQSSAPCNDGTDWIRRADARITAGYVGAGEVGFMWTANSRQNRPFPYVRVIRLREGPPLSLLTQQDIWNGSYLYAYPDTSTNSNGDVGVTMFRGGGAQMPGHVVGNLNRATGAWQLAATRDGTNGPSDNTWGDYLGCRRDSSNPTHWVASGYTLQGGKTRDFIEPRYVRFSV